MLLKENDHMQITYLIVRLVIVSIFLISCQAKVQEVALLERVSVFPSGESNPFVGGDPINTEDVEIMEIWRVAKVFDSKDSSELIGVLDKLKLGDTSSSVPLLASRFALSFADFNRKYYVLSMVADGIHMRLSPAEKVAADRFRLQDIHLEKSVYLRDKILYEKIIQIVTSSP